MKSSLLLVYLSIFIFSNTFLLKDSLAQIKNATDIGNWHDPGIWTPTGVPTESDSVFIFTNVIISPDSNAYAKYVYSYPGGIINIERDLIANKPGRLFIKNSPDNALVNNGVINHGGKLTIEHAQDTAIINYGTIHIQERAQIVIDSCSVDLGVYNDGLFRVSGDLEISNLDGTDEQAIANLDTVLVDTSGSISIYNVNKNGIVNNDFFQCFGDMDVLHCGNWAINNRGNFIVDTGMIVLDSIDSGIVNVKIFENRLNGSIVIGYTTRNFGFYNNSSFFDPGFFYNFGLLAFEDVANKAMINNFYSEFHNTGTLSIRDKYPTSTGTSTGPRVCLDNDNDFYNHPGGIFIIDSINVNGIMNQDSFLNQGSLVINEIGGLAIINSQDFINEDSVVISFVDSTALINDADALMENRGFISIDSTKQSGIVNEGRFANNDILRMRRIGESGIINKYYFSNDTSGKITIQNLSANRDALYNFGDTSTFLNKGSISLDRISGHGILNIGTFTNSDSIILSNIEFLGIANGGSFTNLISGYILIKDSTIYSPITGISNTSGNFLNEGICNIQNCITALYNSDTLTNQQEIIISQCKSGLRNLRDGSFENHHQINIMNVDDGVFLDRESSFTNFPGATLSTGSVLTIPFEAKLGAIFIGEGVVDIQN